MTLFRHFQTNQRFAIILSIMYQYETVEILSRA